MKKLLFTFFFIIGFWTQAYGSEVEGLADQVLVKTGTYEMLSSFPEMIQAQAAQESPFSRNQEATQKAVRGLISSFNEVDARFSLLNKISENFTADELSKILDWLNSPLGTRFIASELEAASVEGQNNLLRYVATLSSNPPLESRILLIQEFERKSRLTDLTMNMLKSMMMGMAKTANASLSNEEKLEEAELIKQMEEIYTNMEPMMRESIWQQMLLTSHYSYRDFSDDELSEYIKFIDSDIGKKYVSVGENVIHVFTKIFTDALSSLNANNQST